MGTMPTDLGIAPQTLDFKPPKRSFVLHNAKEKDVDVSFISYLMTVPGKNRMSVHESALDADGDAIPGTLVVSDIYQFVPALGDEILVFDAGRAVAHILGIQRGQNQNAQAASSRYALGGLSLLPLRCTKDVWRSVLKDGEKRAFLIEVDNARNVIAAHDSDNARRRQGGNEPVAGGPAYDRARWVLGEYEKLYKREVSIHVNEQQVAQDAEAMEIADDVELSTYVHARAIEIANGVKAAENVDKVELAKRLLDDPNVRMKLGKEYRIRKRGHLPQQAENLRAVADAGLTVSGSGLEE